MQLNTLSILAALAPAVMADFKVFCGERCVQDAGGCGAACIFMNNPASCDDVANSVNFQMKADASGGCGGYACDGCDLSKPPGDWEITRLEINNQQFCTPSTLYWGNGGDHPHFTIYNEGGNVNILDVNNNNVGTCVANTDPQIVQCPGVWGNTGLANQFDCTSDLYYLESAN